MALLKKNCWCFSFLYVLVQHQEHIWKLRLIVIVDDNPNLTFKVCT
jgi:hypothetical protein